MKLKSLIIRWFWACVDFITRPGKDVYYALKAILSVRSGFESLQSRSINEWYPLTVIHIMSVLVSKMGDIFPFL